MNDNLNIDTDRKTLAKKYEKIKLTVSISEGVASFILMILFVALGYSNDVAEFFSGITGNRYLALLIFVFIIGLVSSLLTFPLDYYFGFRLEHKFGLSNQSFKGWIIESLKGILVGILLGVPVLLIFYFLLSNFELWWLWLSLFILLFSVVLNQIAPILIFPIFYKFKPVENEEVNNKIKDLCSKIGFRLKGVYQFDMSKNTKKANAAFTGLGKTKRIILGDTLLSGFSPDEIEMVFAHELGHYKKGHIKKNIFISIFSTIAGLYIISLLYEWLYPLFGFQNRWDIGALPILVIISSFIGVFTKPFTSWLSRKYEYEADRFAISTTGKFDVFKSTMEKLAFQNLANEEPNRYIEMWFYSHPSIKKRIAAAREYSERISSER